MEKIIETLKKVIEYCNATECNKCIFCDGKKCMLTGSPTAWTLEKGKEN